MPEPTGGGSAKVDRYARQRAAADAAKVVDFDAWRARHVTHETPGIVIGGRTFRLPKQLPLMFTLERRRLTEILEAGDELSEEQTRKMVAQLFGPDALDHFVAQGLDHDDMNVLLMWGGANTGAPRERVTLDEVRAEYERMQAEGASGKANRATRRKSGKRGRGRKSSSTGR